MIYRQIHLKKKYSLDFCVALEQLLDDYWKHLETGFHFSFCFRLNVFVSECLQVSHAMIHVWLISIFTNFLGHLIVFKND